MKLIDEAATVMATDFWQLTGRKISMPATIETVQPSSLEQDG